MAVSCLAGLDLFVMNSMNGSVLGWCGVSFPIWTAFKVKVFSGIHIGG